jgi:FAD:protein FMN transferase
VIPETTYRQIEPLMGTVASVITRGITDPGLVDAAFSEMRRIEQMFSTFLPNSAISQLGRGEITMNQAPWEVRDVLAACDRLVEGTGGRFQHCPSGASGSGIDPSAYVKGWAGDQAAAVLRRAGVDRFSINVGGDVVSSGGTSDTPWNIGVRHPAYSQAAAAVLPVRDAAVATSGAYERGDHIWGPDRSLDSVTVIGPELAVADALSTAIFAGGVSDLNWLKNYREYETMFISRGRVNWTTGLEGLLCQPLRV